MEGTMGLDLGGAGIQDGEWREVWRMSRCFTPRTWTITVFTRSLCSAISDNTLSYRALKESPHFRNLYEVLVLGLTPGRG